MLDEKVSCALVHEHLGDVVSQLLGVFVRLDHSQGVGRNMLGAIHMHHCSAQLQLVILGHLSLRVLPGRENANGRRAAALQRAQHRTLGHASPTRGLVVRSEHKLSHLGAIISNFDAERALADRVGEDVGRQAVRDAVGEVQSGEAGRGEQDAGKLGVGGVELGEAGVPVCS